MQRACTKYWHQSVCGTEVGQLITASPSCTSKLHEGVTTSHIFWILHRPPPLQDNSGFWCYVHSHLLVSSFFPKQINVWSRRDLLRRALRLSGDVLWLHTEPWSRAGGPRSPLFPVVIDRQLNPREAKGNNIKMHVITLFFVPQAFLPHVWHVSEITLHVWKGLEMILLPVLACSSYQFLKYTAEYHAVIRAYCVEELNYDLSLQRFTSDTTRSAPFDCKNVWRMQ